MRFHADPSYSIAYRCVAMLVCAMPSPGQSSLISSVADLGLSLPLHIVSMQGRSVATPIRADPLLIVSVPILCLSQHRRCDTVLRVSAPRHCRAGRCLTQRRRCGSPFALSYIAIAAPIHSIATPGHYFALLINSAPKHCIASLLHRCVLLF